MFFFSFLSSSYFYSCLAISFFFNFICLLLTVYLSLTIIWWLLLLLLYYHCYDYYYYNCYFDWYYRYSYSWEIKWVRVPSKKFKRHGLPLFITLSDKQAVSEAYIEPSQRLSLFLILLKGLRPLCNIRRSSVLFAVGVLYLPLHFNIIVIIIVVVIIALLILLLLLIFFLLFQLLLEFLSRAVYCSYEVSWPFGFVSFNFFIYLNLIHATTIWCWRTTSILSFGII